MPDEERPPEDEKVVEGEVVDDQPSGAQSGAEPGAEPRPARRKSFFHPLSGAVILGVDWLAFGMDFFSGFAALLAVCLAAFVATFYAVLLIQRRYHDDKPGPALVKALLGALAAGVPFPVTGTVVGAAIIALSGLPALPSKKRP